MRPSFLHKLLNGHFGDPCLFVRMPHERRALQFDIGDISALSPSETYKISDVFVTHTHIDHFIGFDLLLRMILRRESPLNIYGPPNIIACVEGKLKGYTWNLIEDYPVVINTFAYDGKTVSRATFSAKNRFKKEVLGKFGSDGILLRDPQFKVRAIMLDHGTPCLAYSIEEKFHINIDKNILEKKGFTVGPWLTDFKRFLRQNPGSDGIFTVEGKSYRVSELSEITRVTKGQKISYATDLSISEKNISGLIELAKDSDLFYCEAYFLEKDRERAIERFHLTAKTVGSIAKQAGVKKLVLMHFSPKYMDSPDLVINEAMEEFKG
jgi:ribonuclease Z